MGLKPVFCDIDPVTLNMCPTACERLISEHTTAIIPTHVWGQPCSVAAFQELCDEHDLKLIYDSAHAFGCKLNDRPIGGCGDAEIFSLHATKILHSFEGGFVATNNANLAGIVRKSRNFGFTGFDQIDFPGTNAKMSESHAAMGLANLDNFELTKSRAKACFETYSSKLADIPGITLRRPDPTISSNFHYVATELESELFGVSRDRLVEVLARENILARRYFYPGSHRMKPHFQAFSKTGRQLPATEKACAQSLVLPSGAALTPRDVEVVCDTIKLVHKLRSTL